MKKTILAFAAVAMLGGCAHTYYSNSEKYIQDYNDCVVKTNEYGVLNKTNTGGKNRVVYPNTTCAEVIANKSAKTAAPQTDYVAPTYTMPTYYYTAPAATVRTQRVYLRNNCAASYGQWC